MKFIDLTGMRFHMLTVLSRAASKHNKTHWKCLCDCGKEAIVEGYSLRTGKSKSCGCWVKTKWDDYVSTKKQPLYGVWLGMKARCNNENVDCYKYYGGRGIRICEEWRDYSSFKNWALDNGYEKGLYIDRIDVNGDYEPSNCRFVTQKTQQRNRRNNSQIKIDDSIYFATDLAEMLGIPSSTISKWTKNNVLYHKLIFGIDYTRKKAKVTISEKC